MLRTVKKLGDSTTGHFHLHILLTKLESQERQLLVLSPHCLKAFAMAFLHPVGQEMLGKAARQGPYRLPHPCFPGQHSKQPEDFITAVQQ